MSKDAVLSSSRSINDGGASGALLSKAPHPVRRSPSKKHKSQSSNPLPSLDQVFYETQKAQASEYHPAAQQRPNVYRNQTAPLKVQTTKLSLGEGRAAQSAVEATMLVTPFANNHKRETSGALSKSAGAAPSNGDSIHPASSTGAAAPPPAPASISGNQTPNVLYQYIHEMASKRISTLDYFRKAHEGRVFWFNTVHFSRPDISKLPNFSATKISHRATNYLLLGLSIPPVLDVHPQNSPASSAAANASVAYDFLKTLNALLGEFESYQLMHPPDGSTASTLSRARIPHMFKRATQATSSRARRSSSNTAPEIGPPLPQTSSSHASDTPYHHNHHHHGSQSSTGHSNETTLHPSSSTANPSITGPSSHPTASSISLTTSSFSSSPFPAGNSASLDLPNSTLFPNEGPYTYLLTPPLPFPPDFYTVFATLCDVLIDTYQRVLALINSPAVCTGHGLGEMFAKADARLRKVIVAGVVREFEGAAREGGRREVLGVQRVVLGGLMGS